MLTGLGLFGIQVARQEIKLMLRVYRYLFGVQTSCSKTGFAPALECVLLWPCCCSYRLSHFCANLTLSLFAYVWLAVTASHQEIRSCCVRTK